MLEADMPRQPEPAACDPHTAVVAASLALSAFAVAVLAGLVAGAPAATVLLRAVLSMIVCWVVGYAAAIAWRWVLRESSDRESSPGEPPGGGPADGVPSPATGATSHHEAR